MEITEFRKSYLNDIKAIAIQEAIHPTDVFLRDIKDILIQDFSYLSDLIECYVEQERDAKFKRRFKVDAGYFEISSNTLNLLIADFNDEDEMVNITSEDFRKNAELMISFVENFIFNKENNLLDIEDSQPHVQLAVNVRQNLKDLYNIQLFYASTNPLSKTIKNIQLDDLVKFGTTYKVKLDVIDIRKIYNTKAADFKKEPIEIETLSYGIEGIQAVKAHVQSDDYEAYLAVVPGTFLSKIYLDHGSRLLEANVRSFLNTNGAVNKGIQKTILNDQSKFFAYNNGISTTAKAIEFKESNKGLLITKFNDFQIINGGQTTASLASASIREKADLSNVFVQMKLTILKKENPELIRLIAKYANSQNKVTTADLSSNHPYFVKIEEYSRKIYTTSPGLPYQTRWFFERARGQYKQSMLKMTNSEINSFERINPKTQKFTKTDLAKFLNSYELKPFDVAWGSEVNAARFVEEMELMWDDDPNQFNEIYFKKLIAKAILFKTVERVISAQEWYQQRKGYRAEMVGYIISKLVLDLNNENKQLDLLTIWQNQKVDEDLENELSTISFLVFNHFYDEQRPVANIREYSKKEICWTNLKNKKINYSNRFFSNLKNLKDDYEIEKNARNEVKENNELNEEIEVFKIGKEYWNNLLQKGLEKKVLSEKDVSLLSATIKYCNGSQIKYSNLIARYVIKLRKNLLSREIINE